MRSIDAALESQFDVDAAVARVFGMIVNLPQDYLYHVNRKGKITFYKRVNGAQRYIKKTSREIYLLARRQYLLLLVEVLKLTGYSDECSMIKRNELIAELHSLIHIYDRGNLDLAQIVMTPKQYKWYSGEFKQKALIPDSFMPKDSSMTHISTEGVVLRSKSERDIINTMHDFAIPVHYEEERSVMVQPLVDSLYYSLREKNLINGNLFYNRGDVCYWRVPKELEWMNTSGSIWKTYNPRTGRIYIYNDFKILLASGEELIWEHHGMCHKFTYRNNAGERIMILKYTQSVPRDNLIETFEHDAGSPEKIAEILRREVLPRLWF